MKNQAFLIVFALALASGAAPAQNLPPAHILDLNCMEALAAAGRPELAGIFAYVPDADTSAAFADLIVHDHAALRRFMIRLEKDAKDVSGISSWDHDAVAYALSIYASPAAATVKKPSSADLSRLKALLTAPTMSLEEMTARRALKKR
ncbi:MAG: hypothetical protein ACYCPQ_02980 [Elusimicrobiota bacterium]